MKHNARESALVNMPTARDVAAFRAGLIHWFKKHGRDFPWRRTADPFRLLIAEMMLRRTKADQVRKVYDRLFEKYPDARALGEAQKEDLEKIFYPLGLKWRTPAFQLVARETKEKYDGKVPETREELKKLPGVGDYVAGAVLSIAFGRKEWIVDSNIVRLFKRYFGVRTSREGRRDKHIVEIAKMYASTRNPQKASLAILDFTALVCTPRNPKHDICPLRRNCQYARSSTPFPPQS
ncbi:MAG: DNA glycosylase [Chloroflexi bacterium]|nr:DNA glycosylase [Chloroflexota bacterium]